MKFAAIFALACLAVASAELHTTFLHPEAVEQIRAKHYG